MIGLVKWMTGLTVDYICGNSVFHMAVQKFENTAMTLKMYYIYYNVLYNQCNY